MSKYMKIYKVASICKKRKSIILCDGGEYQWCGDGYALYPLLNMLEMNEDSIYSMFDVKEAERHNIYFERKDLPEPEIFEDLFQDERVVDKDYIKIKLGKSVYIPLETSKGLMFINDLYLSPLYETDEEVVLYERKTIRGEIYIAAKVGFLIRGVILPMDLATDELVETFEEFAEHCKYSYLRIEEERQMHTQNKKYKEESNNNCEQMSFGTEGTTGEGR